MKQPITYITRPLTVEALQWDGTDEDAFAIMEWIKSVGGRTHALSANFRVGGHLQWFVLLPDQSDAGLRVDPYDYIVKDHGAIMPISKSAFQHVYEPGRETSVMRYNRHNAAADRIVAEHRRSNGF